MTTSSSASHLAPAAGPAGPAGAAGAAGQPGSSADRDPWLAVRAALPSLRLLQRAALGIYGRLEPDRALVWTVEELGELAQAVRRQRARRGWKKNSGSSPHGCCAWRASWK